MYFPIIRRDPCRLHIGKTLYNLLYSVPGDTKCYQNKMFNSNNIYYKKKSKINFFADMSLLLFTTRYVRMYICELVL